MATVDVEQWLEQWVEANLAAAHVDRKAEMHDAAKACAEAATAAGISIAEIKVAAAGDLEAYFRDRQNISARRAEGDVPGGLSSKLPG